MRRRLIRWGLLFGILLCAGLGEYSRRSAPGATWTMSQAVLRIPREIATSGQLFVRPRQKRDETLRWAPSILEETLKRMRERGIAWSATQEASADLLQRLELEVESEAGEERATISFRTTVAEEAVPVLSALIDTVREVESPSLQLGPARELAETEAHLAEKLKQQEDEVRQRQQALQSEGISEVDRLVLVEQLKSVAVGLAEARRDRLEAEQRLLQTQKDLAAGLPLESLLSRLPTIEAQDAFRKRLSRPRLLEELDVERETVRELARIYGRNHPKMTALVQKVKALESESKILQVSGTRGEDGDPQARLLVRLLASDREERQSLEADLQEQFDSRKGALDQQTALERGLSQAQNELKSLNAERDAARRKIADLRDSQRRHVTEVLSPPALVDEAESSPWFAKWGWLILSSAGSGCGALIFWQLRRRSERHVNFATFRKPESAMATEAFAAKEAAATAALEALQHQEDRAARLLRLQQLNHLGSPHRAAT